MTNKNLTKVAPYPAVIAKMVANPAEPHPLENSARGAFEREMAGHGFNFEWNEIGGCYNDYQTRWMFNTFFVGYRAGKEE